VEHVGGPRWKARVAWEVAEMHFRACDTTEARNWYQEVIKLAPESEYAGRATERLKDTAVMPAGGQSAEPPLADAKDVQVRVRIP
jgi:catechol-2,3-dioxygenase